MPIMLTKEDLEKMRSEPLLSEFWKYCIDNPEIRFWQALRNWSGHNFIMVAEDIEDTLTYEDTFHWEGKDN